MGIEKHFLSEIIMIRKQKLIKPKSSLPIFLMMISLLIISIIAVTNNYWSKSEEYLFTNKECQPYFDFDEIVYYHSDVSDFEVLGRKKDDLHFLLFRQGFESLQDSIYIERGDSLLYKKVISKEEHSTIDKIFCYQPINLDDLYVSECIAIYRDIFVFRKEKKIIGMAKICLDCNQFSSVGTDQKTDNFGMNNEFSNLTKLIEKIKN